MWFYTKILQWRLVSLVIGVNRINGIENNQDQFRTLICEPNNFHKINANKKIIIRKERSD